MQNPLFSDTELLVRKDEKLTMSSYTKIHIIGFIVVSLASTVWGGDYYRYKTCGFPAIYNFGDSNSDTGAASAAFAEVNPPNGESFYGSLSGRGCDGRLIIDFISKY